MNLICKIFLVILFFPIPGITQTTEISIGRVESGDLDYKGFALARDSEIKITGSAVLFDRWDNNQGFYGWIVKSDTREVAWHLLESREQRQNLRREHPFDFEETVFLKKGDYEAYYTGIYWSNDEIQSLGDIFRRLFDSGNYDLDRHDRRDLKMVISGPESILMERDAQALADQTVQNAIVSFMRAGNNEDFEEGFSLKDETKIRIYAYAEGRDGTIYDNAWIYDVKNNRRVWDINPQNAAHAGGADKNIVVDEEITLPAGSYQVRYVSDDSHSFEHWNAFPPNDPQFWGVTLWASSKHDLSNVIPFKEVDVVKPIVELTRVRDDELLSRGITVKKPVAIRILCVGEGTREMADYGWVIDADTRQVVWEMKRRNTEHAGGADKNRMVDETLDLQKGNYIVFYVTDDSHSYQDWNSSPPYEPERWGITIWTVNEDDRDKIEYFNEHDYRSKNTLGEIIRVRDDEYRHESFFLQRDSDVRIYAIGEGRRNEMYDYGWIKNDATGETVWEMTYRKTDPAGGDSKNRLFNDTIFLEKGNYTVYFESDDSHSYKNWNTDPPRDKERYGITVTLEK